MKLIGLVLFVLVALVFSAMHIVFQDDETL